jgi:hypothetical protein
MDEWQENEIQLLIDQLNPHLQTPTHIDHNWQKLKLEQTQQKVLYDLNKTVKTQTPVLLEFDKNYSFSYRRWDGAHWHTEYREIETEGRCQGLTTLQKQFKDSLDTLFAIGHANIKRTWITPLKRPEESFDPTYQLVKIDQEWFCLIDNALYAQSRRTKKSYKNYHEIGFSTRNPPVFTQEFIDKKLDQLLGEKNER